MTMNFHAAIDRAFSRAEKVIAAIEAGDLEASGPIAEMQAAQPWDLVAIGQDFVRDTLQSERDADDGRPASSTGN